MSHYMDRSLCELSWLALRNHNKNFAEVDIVNINTAVMLIGFQCSASQGSKGVSVKKS